jgi:dienelactone hydrolase
MTGKNTSWFCLDLSWIGQRLKSWTVRAAMIFLGCLGWLLPLPARSSLHIDSSVLTPGRQCRLAISGGTNTICVIEVSTNLINWNAVSNIFNSTGSFVFTDASGLTQANRFYRVHTISQIPGPQTKTNMVRIPNLGNSNGGQLTTTVTYQATTATATAATGNTIFLGKGFQFRLTTVVGYHAFGQPPDNRFATIDIDTRANSGAIYTNAPTVIYTAPRPAVGEAHFTPYVQVTYLDTASGDYLLTSHSWPDNELQGAGMPIAAQNQIVGAPLPASETTELDGPFTGAIDSGEPDSLACGVYLPPYSSVPSDLVTNSPAFAGAPAYYEVGAPTGSYAGHAPRAVALLLHGSGWHRYGPGSAESMRSTADRWRARGFQTVNASYRPGALSFTDTLWFFDHIRSAYGPSLPLVTIGQSSGAHLALLAATYRTNVYAVVSEAGPTDIQAVASQPAYDSSTGGSQTNWPRWLHNLGSAAFGVENLPLYNVVGRATTLTNARILQAIALNDTIVPTQQLSALQSAIHAAKPSAYVDDDLMPAGSVTFVHGSVSTAANNDFINREQTLISTLPP